jgi:outer membrane lipoprotein-sorting protein
VSLLRLACIAALTVCAAASADPSGPTVEEIVARHLDACGGIKRIQAIETLRESGRVSVGADRQALVVRERKRPDRTRFEFTTQGVTGVFVSNGKSGWRMSPFDSDASPTPLPDEAVEEAAEQADVDGPLVEWKAKGHQVELVGHKSIRGRDAYELKLTLKSGAVRYEYIDVVSMLRVRTVATRHIRGRPVEIQTSYGEYKKRGGVQFPHRIEVTAAGRPQTLRVVIDKIEINPALPDSRFDMPKSPK